MTPEQMREAAAKVALKLGDSYAAHSVAHAIRAIPIATPEPPMKDRIAEALHGHRHWSYDEDATKVLETMREPTEAMIKAGTPGIGGRWVDGRDTARDTAISVYQAMIDAALAQNPHN